MGCMPSKPVPRAIVVGASGYVGKATLAALKSRHGSEVEVFAGTRDPTKWEAMPGVSATKTDMSDKETLVQTLKTFSRVFIVVPGTKERTKMAVNALEAAKEAGCEFVLLLSVLTCETDTVFGNQFKPIEARCKELELPSYAIIRLPLFMDNIMMNASSVKEESTFYDPRDPSKPYTPVAVQDVGKTAADIIANPDKHKGKTYKLVCPAFSLNDLAAAFSTTLDKTVKSSTVHYNAAKESMLGMGFPEWQVGGILELYGMIDDGSSVTNEANTSDIETITGEKATTIKDWVEQNKTAFQ